jgi:hypothetical protein
MMRTKIFILFTALSVIFFACTSPYKNKVQEVDNWIEKVTVKDQKIRALDSAKVKEIGIEYAKNIALLRSKLESYTFDSIDQEMSNTIQHYKGLKKGTARFPMAYSNLKRESEYTLKQLNDLRAVLSAGKIDGKKLDEELAEKYFNDEKNAVNLLLTQITETISLYESILATHDTLTPKVKKYLEKL